MLSFQVRVLILVMLVAMTATAATAWLAFRLASSQIAASQAADDEKTGEITRTLVDHALRNGSWDGLPSTVADLERKTGQRLFLRTESGTTVGNPAGASAPAGRSVSAQTIRVDPRPLLVLREEDAAVSSAVTLLEIDAFRAGTRLASCLGPAGLPVAVTPGPNGVPHFAAAPPPAGADAALTRCRSAAVSTDAERNQDLATISSCTTSTTTAGQRTACLKNAFTGRVGQVGPEPLLVQFAAGGGGGLTAAPMVGAAVLVMVFAAVGSAVVTRRALRPIDALTRAVRQLGRGDLRGRAQVRGNDQVAELTRSFNRMADSLQEGEERQRRMIADVAHELRTPLSNLRGHLEGLMDGMIPPGPVLFASLHDEALLQQRIVDDLQDLALAEAGALTYRRCRVDLAELLETCQHAHRARAEATGARLVVQTARHILVDADPDRLRQVISNLVSNALRYTPAGGTVALRSWMDGDRVVVDVTDTGCGIAEDDLPKVFDRFWRADSARGRSTGGSGLGLAIARQIIDDHGGTISVRSRPGQGATFTLRLPVADPAPTGHVPGHAADRTALNRIAVRPG
ncbi:MAG TPA: ATP-binding protein [Catenuloplanes sp.]|jgi:two-component system sensor histidine kinase BaeS